MTGMLCRLHTEMVKWYLLGLDEMPRTRKNSGMSLDENRLVRSITVSTKGTFKVKNLQKSSMFYHINNSYLFIINRADLKVKCDYEF